MPNIAFSRHCTHSSHPINERGQVLIVIVMMMVVVLTIGLSLATRSLTNVRQTAEEDSSQRAFSAAEAGINVILDRSNPLDTNSISVPNFAKDTSYTTTIASQRDEQITLNGGKVLPVKESVDVWLSEYPNYTGRWDGILTLHFGDPANTQCEEIPAFDIVILSGDIASPTLNRYAYDQCNRGNFSNANISLDTSGQIEGRSYKYKLVLPEITQPGFVMRIIPLYAPTRLAVTTDASNPLPVQGRVIESVGKSGGTQRKIIVVQENPKLPLEIFPYTIYTPSTISL